MTIRSTARALLLSACAGLALTAASQPARAAGSVEVVHWWTSGGEAAALNVLKKKMEGQGVAWKDAAIAGGGGAQARTVLQARIASGNPPTAMQMLGYVIQDWANEGALANLNEVAKRDGWDKVVPVPLQRFDKHDGVWVAAPAGIHSTNWVWVNKALFDKVGGAVPNSFPEFLALAQKFKEAGVIPLAHGGQPWQEMTVFDGAVVSAGGPEFYKKAFIDLDKAALTSDTMKAAFDQLRKLRGLVDPNFSGRDWNLATAMVIRGEAGMQIMGDWAKGEFAAAGKEAGKDYVCFRYPGTQGTVTFNSDAFAFFKVGKDQQAGQALMAADVLSPDFQVEFSLLKGSAPARNDVPSDRFDSCGKKAIADIKEADARGSLLGSMAHGHAAPEAVKGAVADVVTGFFNSDMSSADAVKKLAAAIDLTR
ncbi:ABC transporter substrate-binding protein [Azospirillum sp.]|uniref:ABC transporter substrate-binding protein n=1 Tax=Azospirillum sp. TaxID=34012 RepID=UPI0026372A1E|nr:ABC transporter substrate-binding protein [Azospirillum sp.]